MSKNTHENVHFYKEMFNINFPKSVDFTSYVGDELPIEKKHDDRWSLWFCEEEDSYVIEWDGHDFHLHSWDDVSLFLWDTVWCG